MKLNNKIFKVTVFIFALVFLSLTLLLAIDRAIAFFLGAHGREIICRPYQQVSYNTPEFNYTSQANSLGFRDREFEVYKKNKKRIMVLGDSFVYGWGVDIKDSWPKVLEKSLVKYGFDIEAINLGSPAASPVDYADIAQKAIPLLKPDIVVIAVLQGEDLAQLDMLAGRQFISSLTVVVRNTIKRLYPHISSLIRNIFISRTLTAEQINNEWEKEAGRIVKRLNDEQKERFKVLDPVAKDYFIEGELNPYLINLAMENPDYFLKTLDIAKNKTKRLISIMARQLSRIKKIAGRYNAKVIVVSIPYRLYVSRHDLEAFRKMGFLTDEAMLTTDSPDMAIKTASDFAGLLFLEITKNFREKGQTQELYFEMDSHFNVSGCKLYADLLAGKIEVFLNQKE